MSNSDRSGWGHVREVHVPANFHQTEIFSPVSLIEVVFPLPTEQTQLYWEPGGPHLRFIRFPLKDQNYIGNERIIAH